MSGRDWGPRERVLVATIAVALVLLRSAVFVLSDTAHFESDQAMVGLMAKHLSEFRVFAVFLYGQDYLLGVEPWLAAPLFWVGGPTVAMLKLPLVAINVAVVLLLLHHLERDGGLRPALALVATAFVAFPPPFTSARLVEAGGGTVEPLLWTLLLWNLRARPLLFGAVFAIGFLNREFTAYGLAALVALQLLDGSLFTRQELRRKALAGVSFVTVWLAIRTLAGMASPSGPGSAGVPVPPSGTLLDRFCWEPQTLTTRLAGLFGEHLGLLFGAPVRPLADLGINSRLSAGLDGLWLVLGLAAVVALTRVIHRAVANRDRPWRAELAFSTYLMLVGLQAVVFYGVSRCEVGPPTLRYAMLGLYVAVGLAAAHLIVERRRPLAILTVAVVLLWCSMAAVSHGRLAHEYLTNPPQDRQRTLADHLLANDVTVGRADYWDAYEVSFLSRERVVLASTSIVRVLEYVRRADEASAVVAVSRAACAGGLVVDVTGDAIDSRPYFVCPSRDEPGTTPPGPVSRPCPGVPAVPTVLTAAVTGNTATFTWRVSADGCPATSFILEAGSAPQRADLATLDTGSAVPRFVARAVAVGTYYVRVWARNSSGLSEPSNEVVVVVP